MGSNMDLWARGSRIRLSDEFVHGLQCFQRRDYEGALMLFRQADERADLGDIYQNRYTSFHGLARVYMGDPAGVKLCRQAAVGETGDAEVYYNLAMAENRLDEREGAWMALRRGLRIDPGHRGLQRLKQEIGLRQQHGIIRGLRRDHWLNRLLGKLLRGSRRPRSGR